MSSHDPRPKAQTDPAPPSFAEATLVWLRIGLLSFGGPAGQIALMHRELVEQRRWISDAEWGCFSSHSLRNRVFTVNIWQCRQLRAMRQGHLQRDSWCNAVFAMPIRYL